MMKNIGGVQTLEQRLQAGGILTFIKTKKLTFCQEIAITIRTRSKYTSKIKKVMRLVLKLACKSHILCLVVPEKTFNALSH